MAVAVTAGAPAMDAVPWARSSPLPPRLEARAHDPAPTSTAAPTPAAIRIRPRAGRVRGRSPTGAAGRDAGGGVDEATAVRTHSGSSSSSLPALSLPALSAPIGIVWAGGPLPSIRGGPVGLNDVTWAVSALSGATGWLPTGEAAGSRPATGPPRAGPDAGDSEVGERAVGESRVAGSFSPWTGCCEVTTAVASGAADSQPFSDPGTWLSSAARSAARAASAVAGRFDGRLASSWHRTSHSGPSIPSIGGGASKACARIMAIVFDATNGGCPASSS